MRRTFQLIVVLFWLVMNAMLIRSELGDPATAGVPVPPELVWRKVIQASDQSLLALTHRGQTNRIGSFRWMPTTLERGITEEEWAEGPLVEGMAAGVAGYTLDLDGNLLLPLEPGTGHVRVSMLLRVDASAAWSDLTLQLGMKPMSWTLTASAATNGPAVQIRSEGPGGVDERVFTAADLTNPERLFAGLGAGGFPGFFMGLSGLARPGSGSPALELDARRDYRLQFGSQRIRCLRLKATWLGSYSASLYVNPVSGEILRLDLPNQISFINETFL